MAELIARTEFPHVDGTLVLVKYSFCSYFVLLDQTGDNVTLEFDNPLDAMAGFLGVSAEMLHDDQRTVLPMDMTRRLVDGQFNYANCIVEPSNVPSCVTDLL